MTPRMVRTLPVPLLLAAMGFTLAVAQDAPPGPAPAPPPPQPPAPKDGGGAAPAPPAEPAFTPPAILAQRRKGMKEPAANAAVQAGLDWLRRHLGPKSGWAGDGRWDCDGFGAVCQGAACSGDGEAVFDPAVSALATLAFLGTGATHLEGPDAPRLAAALQYFQDVQDSEGCFGPRTSQDFQYNHRLATTAVAEALWLTGDEKLLGPVSKARDFVLASKNPYLAWRYGVRDGDNDSSLTSYAVLALRTCEFARLDVDTDAWTGARAWFDKMSDPEFGRVGYQQRGGQDARAWSSEREPEPDPPPKKPDPPPGPADPDDPRGVRRKEFVPLAALFRPRSAARAGSTFGFVGPVPDAVIAKYPDTEYSALTAAAGASMSLVGGSETAPLVDRWAAFIAREPPRASRAGYLDLHYMLFGSLFHAQRPVDVRPKTEAERKHWRPWRDAVVADLTSAQRAAKDGCAAGSWDPDADPFGFAGGRVYSTAMAVLALQAPNRFPKVWNPRARKLQLGGK